MKFETIIEECKPKMYSIFNQYNVEGYDSDDLFQETVIWILRDWETIINLDNCAVKTAIISRAKWACNHLKFYNPNINSVPITDFSEERGYEGFTEFDMAHLFIRAKNRLSHEAFLILSNKIKPSKKIKDKMKKEFPTDRSLKKNLGFNSTYSYHKAMNEIRKFLNDEGIHSNKR